jgi:hypothetical protein
MLAWLDDAANAELAFLVGVVLATAVGNRYWRRMRQFWPVFPETARGNTALRVVLAGTFMVSLVTLAVRLLSRDLDGLDILHAAIYGVALFAIVCAFVGLLHLGRWLGK